MGSFPYIGLLFIDEHAEKILTGHSFYSKDLLLFYG